MEGNLPKEFLRYPCRMSEVTSEPRVMRQNHAEQAVAAFDGPEEFPSLAPSFRFLTLAAEEGG